MTPDMKDDKIGIDKVGQDKIDAKINDNAKNVVVGKNIQLTNIEINQSESQRDSDYRTVLNWDGKTRLRGLDLTRQDLSGMDLIHADLRGSTLRGADLSGAKLY